MRLACVAAQGAAAALWPWRECCSLHNPSPPPSRPACLPALLQVLRGALVGGPGGLGAQATSDTVYQDSRQDYAQNEVGFDSAAADWGVYLCRWASKLELHACLSWHPATLPVVLV